MSAREVVILGSGKRVLEAALPALHRLDGRFSVRRIYARRARRVEVEGRGYDVAPIDELGARDLAGAGLLYVAVAKDAVPSVLTRLVALDVAALDLLIDTPVVRFRHFRHVAKLRRFRNAWVSEDCTVLPWFDTVRAACSAELGLFERVVFERSAYAYHGVASAKALLARDRVLRARRRKEAGSAQRELTLVGGRQAEIVEPRDYAVGHVELECAHGTISDRAERATQGGHLQPIVEDGLCRGFRIGAVRTELDVDEADLTRGDPEAAGVTARMDAMKRVGFLRLLRDIHAGRGAYPLDDALEDMVVDYYLEKLGHYRSTALTSPHSGPARLLLSAVSRLGG